LAKNGPATSMPVMHHHTKTKGDIGVGMVISDLMIRGYGVCLPLSEHMPFDIVAVSHDGQLSRVQVKYAATKDSGAFCLSLRNTYSTSKLVSSKRIDSDKADGWAVYNPQAGIIYVPIAEADGLEYDLTFRLQKAPGSGHAQRLVKDYRDPSVLWRPRQDLNPQPRS
jgi:hypothetical protein